MVKHIVLYTFKEGVDKEEAEEAEEVAEEAAEEAAE